jgi:hypothetical protein
MSFGNVARIVAVLAACAVAAGSASSGSNQNASMMQGYNGQGPPPAQQMEPSTALGLWRSNFGAVKIEADNSKGGLPYGAVQGVWVYQRQGQEVVGYFAGQLRGNVLQFRWQEPNNPPLTGEGYLVFDPQGRQYSGRWWSDRRDRGGDWTGSRNAPAQPGGSPQYGQYGGQGYAAPYAGQPYGDQQPYGGQQQPGPPQPQPNGGQQQPYPPQPQPPGGPQQPQPPPYPAPQPPPYGGQQPPPYGQPPPQPSPPPRGY